MIRPALCLCLLFLLAACAVKRPPAPAPLPPVPAILIPSAPPLGEPKGYLDLAGPDLMARFGTPAFVRKDGVMEMWRYDGPGCRVFFFLYGTPAHVRHVETLPHGAQSAADLACLSALQPATPKAS